MRRQSWRIFSAFQKGTLLSKDSALCRLHRIGRELVVGLKDLTTATVNGQTALSSNGNRQYRRTRVVPYGVIRYMTIKQLISGACTCRLSTIHLYIGSIGIVLVLYTSLFISNTDSKKKKKKDNN